MFNFNPTQIIHFLYNIRVHTKGFTHILIETISEYYVHIINVSHSGSQCYFARCSVYVCTGNYN